MIASVVIPTCERPDDLAACLERLMVEIGQLAPETAEIVVTDDGRSGATEAILAERFPSVRWTEGPRRGPAANRNHGAATARGEWLIFIDDDCLPEPGLLETYLTAIQRGGVRVLEGKTSSTGRRTRIDVECPINETGGKLWSCNMAIRRDLFLAIGGFDTHFPGPAMEDVDLQARLLKAGEAIDFVPEARVLHPWRRRRGLAFVRQSAESLAYFISKHPDQVEIVSVRYLTRDLLRKTLAHLPRLVLQIGPRGLGHALMEAWYVPWAVRRAWHRRQAARVFRP